MRIHKTKDYDKFSLLFGNRDIEPVNLKRMVMSMKEVVDLGVEIFTIGQYLQPTSHHLPVDRFVANEEFQDYKKIGLELGFRVVESGALVRSSYHADEQARMVKGTK